MSNVVSDPKGFCNFVLTQNINNASPFSAMSVADIKTNCKAIVGKRTPRAANYFRNPYFSGSGYVTSDGAYDTLNLPFWSYVSGTVSVSMSGDPVGNMVSLSTSGTNGTSANAAEISQRSSPIYAPRPYRISFSQLGWTRNSTCTQELLHNGRSIWNSTLGPEATIPSAPTNMQTTQFEITFEESNTPDKFAFRVTGTGGSGECVWQVAKVALTQLNAD